jgi:hypothetical protein
MTTDEDIQQMAKLIERIEAYIAGGVYDPVKHKTISLSVNKAETIFRRIIDTYADMTIMPPIQQTMEVSELQKRLHHVGHDMPSPPIEIKGGGGLAGEHIAIYTLST